ncbi:MAG: NAD-dependent epimerase/dehydratase family protein [Planctomycetes bacterium]|jgi:UDP-apiose/xylose synthase|nr:NAD-dependent epimerase/dehydratase family protein [Planctomycetota bacterium]
MGGATICILGGGGFIGNHLGRRLLSEGYRVRSVDRDDHRVRDLSDRAGFEFRRFDVRDEGRLAAAIHGCDVVAHLSSLCNPSLYTTRTLDTIGSNYTQALPVIAACREQGARLLHFSTCEVYGRTLAGFAPDDSSFRQDPANTLLSEESSPMLLGPLHRTRWSYAAAKQLLERTIEAEGRERGLSWTIVRPFNFIGPGMDFLPGVDGEGLPRVMACFASALIRGEPLPLVDGGRARRTFVHIDDAVDAIVRMIDRPGASAGRVFNVGHPENECDMAGLARLMIRAFEELTGRGFGPGVKEVVAEDFYGPGYEDCDRRVPDITRARTLLGWEPRIPLPEAVKRTLSAYLGTAGVLPA